MSEELPSGWIPAPLKHLIDFGPKNYAEDDADAGFVPLQRLGVRFRDKHSFETRRWVEIKKAYTHFADGDVLLARITPSFENGKAGIARGLPNGIGAGSSEYFVCRPRPNGLVAGYLLAHFKTHRFLRDGEQIMSGAVGQQRVPKQYVLDSEIALAPLNEQKRIADKLDALLTRVDACRERLDRVPGILRRFRQSVLAAATSGELTADWREERGVRLEEWSRTTVGALVKKVEAGLNTQCIERPPDQGQTGLVKISAVTWGTYNDDESKTLPPGQKVPSATRIQVGDFLISRANTLELVGACVVVDRVTRPVHLSDKVLRLVLPDDLKLWLLYSLQSPSGRRQIEASATGNQLSMRNLSQASLRAIALALPNEDERREIENRVRRLLSHAAKIEATCAIASAHSGRFTPAILAKAFRGELVPQNPNDEPAEVLLERVRTERATESTTGRRGRGGR